MKNHKKIQKITYRDFGIVKMKLLRKMYQQRFKPVKKQLKAIKFIYETIRNIRSASR